MTYPYCRRHFCRGMARSTLVNSARQRRGDPAKLNVCDDVFFDFRVDEEAKANYGEFQLRSRGTT